MRALRKEDTDKTKTKEPDEPGFSAPDGADSSEQDRTIRRIAEAVHRLNELVLSAVKSGVSIELVRASRKHDGKGNWGDQIVPLVRQAGQERERKRGTEISVNPRDSMP